MIVPGGVSVRSPRLLSWAPNGGRRVLRGGGAVALALAVGCSPRQAVPAATGEATPAAASNAVVAFMQGMIGHHAQALEMTALVPGRSSHPAVRLLAERIEVSQKDEIALMRRWLQNRGHAVPPDDAHVHAAMGHGELMPGMLTRQEMEALAARQGRDFDRLFLQSMIRHHQGALQMVADLLARDRNLDAETFRFVSDIDADQRAEIQRMQTLLNTIA